MQSAHAAALLTLFFSSQFTFSNLESSVPNTATLPFPHFSSFSCTIHELVSSQSIPCWALVARMVPRPGSNFHSTLPVSGIYRKGFTKAVSRLPHTLSTKTGIRDGNYRSLKSSFCSQDHSSCTVRALNLVTHATCFAHSSLPSTVETTDVEFRELNNKFTACEGSTGLLLTEVCKFRDNVTGKRAGSFRS